MRYTGPGAVLVAVAHERGPAMPRHGSSAAWGAPSALTLRELPGRRALRRRQVIALAPGARLLVRSDARSSG